MVKQCHHCGSTDIDTNDSRGETFCASCGAVLEESVMVANMTFQEGSGGIVRATGQFVSAATGKMGSISSASREQLLQRGYSNIQRLADYLKIGTTLVEAAQRVLLLAAQRNFTVGRCSHHVACASLYAVCRRESHPLMLIDFSDVLKTPVKTLARIFTKLLRMLHLHIPTIDPSLFMERYAHELAFVGDQAHQVAATGVRLVQAMSRDWICTGRRPNGLCGAALLIASRYHGFKVDAEDVSGVTRIAGSTVNKRLGEWRHTAVAQLASKDFEGTNLEQLPINRGPPCFEAAKRRRLAIENGKSPRKRRKQLTTSLTDDEDDDLLPLTAGHDEEDDDKLPPLVERSSMAGTLAIEDSKLCEDNLTGGDLERIAAKMVGEMGKALGQAEKEGDSLRDLLSGVRDTVDFGEVSTTADDVALALLLPSQATTGKHGDDDEDDDFGFDFDLFPAISQSVEKEEDEHEALQLARPENLEEVEETLSDVSDSEVDRLLLDVVEKRAKMMIWDQLTASVMPRVQRRWAERKRASELMKSRLVGDADDLAIKKSRRLRGGRPSYEEASTAAESVRIALLQTSKFVGNKVDGEVLLSLFDG